MDSDAPLLKVDRLAVEFQTSRGTIRAVNDFGVSIEKGSSLAIVGESGAGKSVAMRAVLGLYPKGRGVRISGSAEFDGTQLMSLSKRRMREVRGERIALISQDALASLNPSLTIGYQITEALRIRKGWTASQSRKRAVELLDLVGIPSAADRLKDYPHQFSGGMRQRVLIATGLVLDPDLLIADEPTTALDVTIQAQILELLRELRRETGMALVMITHDMGVVAEIAENVTVMYAGSVVESGTAADVFANPRHPYTQGLLAAVPRTDQRHERPISIPGTPPNPTNWPSGCRFHPRCLFARNECGSMSVGLEPVESDHLAACPFWKENLSVSR